ncbi:putative lipid phosphatase CDC1 [Sporobolomyces koalae]|uniref:putative lipid phosphatase CDC1 n=1 Tax=Sporobolomyces koalae TaxID=500713 RepID=UPI0031794963
MYRPAPGGRSPSIRSPSLLSHLPLSPAPTRSTPRKLVPKALSSTLVIALRIGIGLVVLWFEFGSFYYYTSKCSFPSVPSSTSTSAFNLLIVTDPQLQDLELSYPGRNPILNWFAIKVSNLFMKKSWYFVTKQTNRAPIDGIVWNGDLLDNGRDMDPRQYEMFSNKFHLMFPVPRQHRTSHSSPTELDPPVPVIHVVGNHDLPLHPLATSSSNASRELFQHFFAGRGSLYGSTTEWHPGWEIVWIDSLALLEPEFWTTDGGQFSEFKQWIEDLGTSTEHLPRILFTHVPLHRPPGTSCGPLRESNRFENGIRDGFGTGYQNLVPLHETEWVLSRIKPEKVFSGDDHDYCFVNHERFQTRTGQALTETTVKSFSMTMGIKSPGYTLVSLANDSQWNERSCLLPSQLSTYLYIYLPLFLALALYFFSLNMFVVLKHWVRSRRRQRRQRNRTRRKTEKEEVEEDELFSTIGSGNGTVGMGYSVTLGPDEDEGPIANTAPPPRRGSRFAGTDKTRTGSNDSSESEEEEEEDWDEIQRRNSKIRRVSRVWNWNGAASTLDYPSSPALPYSSPSLEETSRSSTILSRLLNRLSHNSLLPLVFRFGRYLSRSFRTLLFILFKKPLELALRPFSSLINRRKSRGGTQRNRGKGLSRAFKETLESLWEVGSIGIGVWIVTTLWVEWIL